MSQQQEAMDAATRAIGAANQAKHELERVVQNGIQDALGALQTPFSLSVTIDNIEVTRLEDAAPTFVYTVRVNAKIPERW